MEKDRATVRWKPTQSWPLDWVNVADLFPFFLSPFAQQEEDLSATPRSILILYVIHLMHV